MTVEIPKGEKLKAFVKKFMEWKAETLGFSSLASPMVMNWIDKQDEAMLSDFVKVLFDLAAVENYDPKKNWSDVDYGDSDLCPFCFKYEAGTCKECEWAEWYGRCDQPGSSYDKMLQMLPDRTFSVYLAKRYNLYEVLKDLLWEVNHGD